MSELESGQSEVDVRSAGQPYVRTVRLRRYMLIRGVTGTELARASGVSGATISHCLNGHRISPRTLKRICIALAHIPTIQGAEDLVA